MNIVNHNKFCQIGFVTSPSLEKNSVNEVSILVWNSKTKCLLTLSSFGILVFISLSQFLSWFFTLVYTLYIKYLCPSTNRKKRGTMLTSPWRPPCLLIAYHSPSPHRFRLSMAPVTQRPLLIRQPSPLMAASWPWRILTTTTRNLFWTNTCSAWWRRRGVNPQGQPTAP